MNKIAQFGLIVGVAAMLGACCSTEPVSCGSASDTFCINLGIGDHGRDVKNWQCFLRAKKFTVAMPDGTFSPETAEATKRFQSSSCYGGNESIAITGKVTYATYWKALRAGLPKYKVSKPSECAKSTEPSSRNDRARRHALNGGVQTRDIGHGDIIYCPMRFECHDKPGNPEVSDWQAILTCFGYTVGNPGDFDAITQTATGNFQVDSGLIGVSGVTKGWVDSAHTFATAKSTCPCPVYDTATNVAGGCVK